LQNKKIRITKRYRKALRAHQETAANENKQSKFKELIGKALEVQLPSSLFNLFRILLG